MPDDDAIDPSQLARAGAPQPSDDAWTIADEDLSDGTRLRVARPPEDVSSLVDAFIERNGWAVRLRGARLFGKWEQIVGADLAKRCEPVRVAGGKLVVRAENQAWATQLRYMTTQLRDQAAAVVGEHLVQEVQIIVGPLQGTAEPDGHDDRTEEDA